jgi:DNA anti-recombination protein RmuC
MSTPKTDQYLAAMQHQWDDFNLQLDQFQSQLHSAAKDAQQEYRAQLLKLRAQSDLAKAQLATLKESSDASWDKAVVEMEKIREAFVHAVKDFKSRI